MSELPMQKKILLGTFALATLLVPVMYGASAQQPRRSRANRSHQPRISDRGSHGRASKARWSSGSRLPPTAAVKDVTVISSSSSEFEAPAMAALLKWRYLPTNMRCVGAVCEPIANAVAVERPGMRTRIRYQLDRSADTPDDED